MVDTNIDRRRREILKAAGSVSIVATTAGCQGGGNGDGGDGSDGSDGGGDLGDPIELDIEAPEFQNHPEEMRFLFRSLEENLGIPFEISTREFGSYLSEVYGPPNDFEHVAYLGYGGSPDRLDPQFLLSLFVGDTPENSSGYANDEYDQLYDEMLGTYDREERSDLIGQMQTMLHEDLPAIAYMRSEALVPYNSRLWEIEPTDFVGLSGASTMSLLDATPQTDEVRTLIMGDSGEWDGANPIATNNITLLFLFMIAYDTPLRLNKDGEFENWAAESIDLVDETTLDITLRDDLTFHDGEPVTADDMTFSLEFYNEYTFPTYDVLAEPIEQVESQDEYTTRVTLSEPNSTFQETPMVIFAILPEHIWAPIPDEVDNPANYSMPDEEMVGSGPFEIVSTGPQRLEFEVNPDHFYDVNYDRFIWTAVGSSEAERSGLEAEDIHLVDGARSASLVEEMSSPDHISVSTGPGLDLTKFDFDNRISPGSDRAFRRAVARAIDWATFSDVHYDNQGVVPDGTPIHPEMDWGRDDLPSLTELYDPDEARQILQDAGYGWDDDGNLRAPTSN